MPWGSGSGGVPAPSIPLGAVQAGSHSLRTDIWNCGASGGTTSLIYLEDVTPTPANQIRQEIFLDCGTVFTPLPPGTGAAGMWTIFSQPSVGTASIGEPTVAVGNSVSKLAPGRTVVRWTVTAGDCGSTYDEYTIIVPVPDANSAPPDVPADVKYPCGVTLPVLLTVSTNSLKDGKWTVSSGEVAVAEPYARSTVMNFAAGGTYTVTRSLCPTVIFSSFKVIIPLATASTADPGPSISLYCNQDAQLSAGDTPGGEWSVISGSATFSDTRSYRSRVSVGIGSNVLRWSACPVTTYGEIWVNRSSVNAPANAGASAFVGCSLSANLNAQLPPGSTGRWIVLSGPGIVGDATNPNASIMGLQGTNTTLQWVVSYPGCQSTSDIISITSLPETDPQCSNCTALNVGSGASISTCDAPSNVVVTSSTPIVLSISVQTSSIVVSSSTNLVITAPSIVVVNSVSLAPAAVMVVSSESSLIVGSSLVLISGSQLNVNQGASLVVSGPVEISGSLSLLGGSVSVNNTFSMTSSAILLLDSVSSRPVVVNGTMTFSGTLIIRITSLTFTTARGTGTTQTASQTITVAQYGSSSSTQFQAVNTQLNYTGVTSCDTATTNNNYGSSTMTVTVTVTRDTQCGQQNGGGGGLSAGAIAGIVIGCLVIVAAFTLLIIFLRKRQVARSEAEFQIKMQTKNSAFLAD